jgi:hypothetical protein
LVFDVTDSDGNYYQFNSNESGFKKFLKGLDNTRYYLMGGYGLLSLSVGLSFVGIWNKNVRRKAIICKTLYTDKAV